MPVSFFNYHDNTEATDIAYATKYSSGIDLKADLTKCGPITIPPQDWKIIPTNLKAKFHDKDFEIQIRSRSGMASRYGVIVLNAPGTIDADYRGEVGVILINLGDVHFTVARGVAIAQLVIAAVARICWDERPVDPDAARRGARGFGSTGT